MKYFYNFIENGYIYSIDMIRVRTLVSQLEAKEIRKFLNERLFNHWYGYGYDKFCDNWKIDKLWLGLGTKAKANKDDAMNINDEIIFCMEFNPNKMTELDITVYNYFINQFPFVVKRFDLAVDIPLNINNIVFSDIYKKSFSLFYNDYNNKTYYIGKGDGHIKIYNKKIESDLDYELTRFEVTKECDILLNDGKEDYKHYTDIDFKFPYLATTPFSTKSIEDDETLDAVLFAVNNGFPYKKLSRRYKSKIGRELVGLSDLNNISANICLGNVLNLIRFRHI